LCGVCVWCVCVVGVVCVCVCGVCGVCVVCVCVCGVCVCGDELVGSMNIKNVQGFVCCDVQYVLSV